MSTEENNFDEILRSKLSEDSFEFNEANWDKAEALVIKAEKKRKRRLVGFIFFIGLILGIGIMLPFIGGEKENVLSENKKPTTEKKDVSAKTKKAEIEEKSITQQVNDASSDNTTKQNKSVDVSPVDKNTYKEETATNSKKEEKNIKGKPLQAVVSNTVRSSSIPKEDKHAITNSSQNNDVKNILASNSENKKAKKADKQKDGNAVVNSSNTSATTKSNETLNKGVTKNNSQKQDLTNVNSNGNQTVLETKDTNHASVTTNTNLVKDTVTVVKDSVVKIISDSVKPATKDSMVNKFSLKNNQGFVYSIDAGANYTLGWTNNSTKEANGFNGIFGISVMHFFNANWSTLLGVQYNSLSHLSYSNYTSSNTQFGFGYNTASTTVTPKMLYYMAIPIKLQYWFNSKNSLSVGANVLYLINTSSTVDTYSQTDFTTSNHTTKTKSGYMDGFSTWDIQPALAYRRYLLKHFFINAEMYYGLMDIKNNSFFGVNKAEHNSGFKLTLSYILSKRIK